ncbi:hypothetical protein, partial [Streptomyces sp. IBSBF 2806]|uniref:hypothetical protein n=1 Tax=Streptomyces sp. IBSBF 2806 TaxID=2903529 RepID=UPI002FDC68AE
MLSPNSSQIIRAVAAGGLDFVDDAVAAQQVAGDGVVPVQPGPADRHGGQDGAAGDEEIPARTGRHGCGSWCWKSASTSHASADGDTRTLASRQPRP